MIYTDSRILALIHHRDADSFNRAISKAISKQPTLEKYFTNYKGNYLIDVDHISIAEAILRQVRKDVDKTPSVSKDKLLKWFESLCKEDISIPITEQAKDMMKRCK